jgi:hypothetical protein
MAEAEERRAFRQRLLVMSKLLLRKMAVEDMGFTNSELAEIEGGNDPEAQQRIVEALMRRWDEGVRPGGPSLNATSTTRVDDLGSANMVSSSTRSKERAVTKTERASDEDMDAIDKLWTDAELELGQGSLTHDAPPTTEAEAEAPPTSPPDTESEPRRRPVRRRAATTAAAETEAGPPSLMPIDGLIKALADDMRQLIDDLATVKATAVTLQKEVRELTELVQSVEGALPALARAAKLAAVTTSSLREITIQTMSKVFSALKIPDFSPVIKEAHAAGLQKFKDFMADK